MTNCDTSKSEEPPPPSAAAELESQNSKSKSDKTFTCTKCQLVFTSQKQWKRHIKQDDCEFQSVKPKKGKRSKTFTCKVCQEQFHSKKIFKSHKKTEHKYKRYKIVKDFSEQNGVAEECNGDNQKVATEKEAVKLEPPEVVLHEESTEITAPTPKSDESNKLYGSSTDSTSQLQTLESQPQEKPYLPVPVFDELKTIYEMNLGCHSVFHSENSCVNCPQPASAVPEKKACLTCGKSFKKNSDLLEHMSVHSTENPFTCSFCGKSFTGKNSLKCHFRVHTGEKPYACQYCGKRFAHYTPFKVHKRIHTGERPYVCRFCSKGYITNQGLKAHVKKCQGLFLT